MTKRKTPPDDAVAALAASVAAAEKVAPLRRNDPPTDHPPTDDGRGDDGGDVPIRADGLPEDCPIIPLGKRIKTFYYLDALRQVTAISDRDHSRNGLAALFAPHTGLLELWWPRRKIVKKKVGDDYVEQWQTTGFKVEDCANQLMDACARLGVWKDHERVRGVGGWLNDDGSLIFHLGNQLWTAGGLLPPGRHDGYVYASDAPIASPYDEAVPGGEDNPIFELYDFLKSWAWKRGAIDAMLLLGWCGCAFVSGALGWRPMVFVTGDKSTGKSTLQKIVGYLYGKGGIVQTADTSAAGLYQEVGHSALPIAIDELESDVNNDKTKNVIRLARIASSGAVMLRGSSEHKGVQFQARSCFLFSAILMPPLDEQDRSRMAILRLDPLPPHSSLPRIDPGYFRDMGAKIKRRLADHWGRFEPMLEAYRRCLGRAGHDSRGCDQFGTLLAVAQLMLSDDSPSAESLKQTEAQFDAAAWRETAETQSEAQKCLDWLAQSSPDVFKGGQKRAISQILADYFDPQLSEQRPQYKDQLAAAGLAIVVTRDRDLMLAVPYTHRAVAAMFQGTRWAGTAGMTGGWIEALTRLAGVRLGCTSRIAGRETRCLHVPIGLLVELPIEIGSGGEPGA
jgi:hypothetical protein